MLAPADFAWADGLRRAHFPPERNLVPAHLTLFHHLPPDLLPELKQRLSAATRGQAPPPAQLAGLLMMGRGVGFRVDSPGLAAIRAELAHAFTGLLTPQDQAGWRAHITIQNKVEPAVAKALHAELAATFVPRPLALAGLAAWFYRGGPWEPVARYPFG